jgi:hypothetical protein
VCIVQALLEWNEDGVLHVAAGKSLKVYEVTMEAVVTAAAASSDN